MNEKYIKIALYAVLIGIIAAAIYFMVKALRNTNPDAGKASVPGGGGTSGGSGAKKPYTTVINANDVVKKGTYAKKVEDLQKALNTVSQYYFSPKLVVDGDFGQKTEDALKAVTGKISLTGKQIDILIYQLGLFTTGAENEFRNSHQKPDGSYKPLDITW